MSCEYLAIVNRFGGLKVLIIGDAMLDVYLDGTVSRICREAPVPIVDIQRVDAMPGGAANAAVNLARLGAEVRYLSIIGRDREGELLEESLNGHGVDTSLIIGDPARQTITKQRITAGPPTVCASTSACCRGWNR